MVALTSKTSGLLAGEFVLAKWTAAGLNIETTVKRDIYTIKETLVRKRVGDSRTQTQNNLKSLSANG